MGRRGDKVVVLGEVLVDLFAQRPGEPLAETDAFLPRLGGAPANVAVQLARLGVSVRMLSAVGADPLGVRAVSELRAEGVDVRGIAVRPARRTGVTLVEVDARGERRFYPFRENSADLSLSVADASADALRAAAILHTGTVSLRSPSSRRATRHLVDAARRQGLVVSLDVNLRWGMFPSRTLLLSLARSAVKRCDIVKATRDEARAILGATAGASDEALAAGLLSRGPRLVLLTADASGAVLATRRVTVHVKAPVVDVVDATGAGDAFVGAALWSLLERRVGLEGLDALDAMALHEIGRVACVAGSRAVTALGATTAMPTRGELPS